MYYWSADETILSTTKKVILSKPTVSMWFKKLRKLCGLKFDERKKLGGEGFLIEIDECLLHGKRKNNRGRYLKGDEWKVSKNKEFLTPSILHTSKFI